MNKIIIFVINFYGLKKSLAHFNLHPIYKHWCIDYELDHFFNAFFPYFSCKIYMTTSHSFSHAFNLINDGHKFFLQPL